MECRMDWRGEQLFTINFKYLDEEIMFNLPKLANTKLDGSVGCEECAGTLQGHELMGKDMAAGI